MPCRFSQPTLFRILFIARFHRRPQRPAPTLDEEMLQGHPSPYRIYLDFIQLAHVQHRFHNRHRSHLESLQEVNFNDRSRTIMDTHSNHAARLIGVAETGTRHAVGGRRTPMSLRAATGIVTGLSGNAVKNRTLSLPRKVLNNNGLHILCDVIYKPAKTGF